MNLSKIQEILVKSNNIDKAKAQEYSKEGNVKVTNKLVEGIYKADIANSKLWTVYYEPTVHIVIANFHDTANDVKFMTQMSFANHKVDGIGYLMSFNPSQCHLYDPSIARELSASNYIKFESIKELFIICLRHMINTQDLHGNIKVSQLDDYQFKGQLD